MPDKVTNVFISGVGGQGILLASEILSEVALARGLDVKKSEVHGMAQRGGSVVSHVRFGEKVYSPVIAEREADLLVSFEKMEGLRWIHYLAPGGAVIVNSQEILPSGLEEYPKGMDDGIRERQADALIIDALALAKEAGNARAVTSGRAPSRSESRRRRSTSTSRPSNSAARPRSASSTCVGRGPFPSGAQTIAASRLNSPEGKGPRPTFSRARVVRQEEPWMLCLRRELRRRAPCV